MQSRGAGLAGALAGLAGAGPGPAWPARLRQEPSRADLGGAHRRRAGSSRRRCRRRTRTRTRACVLDDAEPVADETGSLSVLQPAARARRPPAADRAPAGRRLDARACRTSPRGCAPRRRSRSAPPDDALLGALLLKLFADRQLVVAEALIAYLVRHMERSFAAAQAIVVAALDAARCASTARSPSRSRDALSGARIEPATILREASRWISASPARRRWSAPRARGWAAAARWRWPGTASRSRSPRAPRARWRPPRTRSPRASGGKVTPVAGDITTPEGRAAALAACPEPDILVNNAGGPPPGDFRDWDEEDWLQRLQRQHDHRDHADQGDGRRHDRAQVRPDRQHHLELGQGADPAARPVQRRARRPDRLRRRDRPPDGRAQRHHQQHPARAASTPTGCARAWRSRRRSRAGRSPRSRPSRAPRSRPSGSARPRSSASCAPSSAAPRRATSPARIS